MTRDSRQALWSFALGWAAGWLVLAVPLAAGWLREKIDGRASW